MHNYTENELLSTYNDFLKSLIQYTDKWEQENNIDKNLKFILISKAQLLQQLLQKHFDSCANAPGENLIALYD